MHFLTCTGRCFLATWLGHLKKLWAIYDRKVQEKSSRHYYDVFKFQLGMTSSKSLNTTLIEILMKKHRTKSPFVNLNTCTLRFRKQKKVCIFKAHVEHFVPWHLSAVTRQKKSMPTSPLPPHHSPPPLPSQKLNRIYTILNVKMKFYIFISLLV